MTDNVLKITKTDLDSDNFYVGTDDVADFSGAIEIEAGRGRVRFRGRLKASLSIRAGIGSGIVAGAGIEAGRGIVAGAGIEAGRSIVAGDGIEAGRGIVAGDGIEAGDGIVAGWGIEAGWGIVAGFSVTAKWVSARLRIFVGCCSWRLPSPDEMQLRAELRSGTVAFGTHVIPGQADEEVA